MQRIVNNVLSWLWTSNAPLWQLRPTLFWAASKGAFPEVQEKLSSLSVPSVLMSPHQDCWIQFWSSQYKKDREFAGASPGRGCKNDYGTEALTIEPWEGLSIFKMTFRVTLETLSNMSWSHKGRTSTCCVLLMGFSRLKQSYSCTVLHHPKFSNYPQVI